MSAMKLLPLLLLGTGLVTGCASATPPSSSPSAAMRVCVDPAERDQALLEHWMAGCGKRDQPEDRACQREHEAMFETLELDARKCTRTKLHTVTID